MMRSQLRENHHDFELAIEDLTRAIDLNPANAQAYAKRAMVYARLEDWTLAIIDYTYAIHFEPTGASNYKQPGDRRSPD